MVEQAPKTQTETKSTWFETVFGFKEGNDMAKTKNNFSLKDSPNGMILESKKNGASFNVGSWSTPSLGELRQMALDELQKQPDALKGDLKVATETQNVQSIIDKNPNAVFQAVSQFNSWEVPCGPASVYRDLYAQAKDADGNLQDGQSKNCQIDAIQKICQITGLSNIVTNGYTMARFKTLNDAEVIMTNQAAEDKLIELKDKLRIGLHEDFQVPANQWNALNPENGMRMTQAFLTGCSISYCGGFHAHWNKFAQIILEVSYQATLWAAVLRALKNKGDANSNVVYLTLIGGGVFGNQYSWIAKAIDEAIKVLKKHKIGLDIRIVSFQGPIQKEIQELVHKHNQK